MEDFANRCEARHGGPYPFADDRRVDAAKYRRWHKALTELFTQEDVDFLRAFDVAEHALTLEELEARSKRAASLARRIASLLPPSPSEP